MHCCVGDLKGSFISIHVVYPNLCSTEHQRKCCKKKTICHMRESNEQAPCHAKKKKQLKPEASFSEVICIATVQCQNPQTLPTNFLTKTQDYGYKVDFKCLFTIYYFASAFLWRSLSWCCPGKRKSTPTGQKHSEIWSHNSWNERWAL